MKERLIKPSKLDHDQCLRFAISYRDRLTEDELLALNIVAGNWASGEDVTHAEYVKARAIIVRLGGV